MKTKEKIFRIIFIIVFFIGIFIPKVYFKIAFYNPESPLEVRLEQINKNNISEMSNKESKQIKANKLMIVAHPDDETYWGGAHLLHDDYLVVCVTCGPLLKRVKEFKRTMKKTNDEFMMLGYPDLVDGKKSDWKDVYENIEKDLKIIINSKDWEQIVTHNPDGEYGHIHHLMTNAMVSSNSGNDVLWYFGKFYNRKNVDKLKGSKQISKSDYNTKMKELIPIYKSQKSAENNFKYMLKYENWISSKDWGK